jgi:acetolactate synthase-1/2/3 large subunit
MSGSPLGPVYQALSDALCAERVGHVFSLMGDGNLELLADLAERRGVPLVHARHEQGAVAMADGYARFSGAVGVASVTHGPGLSNCATSLLTAAAARSRVLLLAADTPAVDVDHPQGFDQAAFVRACDAELAQLHAPETFARDVSRAFRAAREGRRPVVLNLPADALRERLPEGAPDYVPAAPAAARAAPDPAAVAAAAELLRRAERPLVLAGLGVVESEGGEGAVGRLADALGAPIATTLMANGLLAAHAGCLGVAGGLGAGPGSAALRDADCVVAIGASLSGWTTDGQLPAAGTSVIHVDADPAAIGVRVPADAALVADAALAADALAERLSDLPDRERPSWQPGPRPGGDDAGAPSGRGLPPREIVAALERALPDERLLVIDAGHFSGYAQQGLRSSEPRGYAFTHQFGAIGQGLGIALGAAVARPGERVTLVLGDGCLLMSVAELDTLARYALPVTVFVMNDEGYGQERHALEAKGFASDEASFATPDLAQLAAGFGVASATVATQAELERLPELLAQASGPLLVDVRTDGGYQNRSFNDIAARLRGS